MAVFIWAWLGCTKNTIERGGYSRRLGLVPIVNVYLFILVSDKPTWWFLFMFIPGANFVFFSIVVLNNLSKIGEFERRYKTLLITLYPIMSRSVM